MQVLEAKVVMLANGTKIQFNYRGIKRVAVVRGERLCKGVLLFQCDTEDGPRQFYQDQMSEIEVL